MKFRYLNESWQMLDADSVELKRKYVDQVWDILQIAYKKIGGIHGSGFRSKEDMIENIPLWKLNIRDGVVSFVAMYKNKRGRKMVALARNFDESQKGNSKTDYLRFMKDELTRERSYGEISDDLLISILNNGDLADLLKSDIIPPEFIADILPDDDIGGRMEDAFEDFIRYACVDKHVPREKIAEVEDAFYSRTIGAEKHNKMMYGRKYLGK